MQQNSAQTQKQAVSLTTRMNVKCWVKEADTIGDILCESVCVKSKCLETDVGDGIGGGSACRGAQGPLLGVLDLHSHLCGCFWGNPDQDTVALRTEAKVSKVAHVALRALAP